MFVKEYTTKKVVGSIEILKFFYFCFKISVVFVKPEPKRQTYPCLGQGHQTSRPAGETPHDTARELEPSRALEEDDGNGESNANTGGFGEQIQILAVACLSESKGDAEIITLFKVAEVMNKTLQRNLSDNGSTPSGDGELSPDGQFATQNEHKTSFPGFRSLISLLGSQSLVSRFGQRNLCVGRYKASGKAGKRDLVAKVSLQVYIVDCPKEPIIEILQFEKHQDMDQLSDHEHKDPYGNLLKRSAHKPLLSSGSGSQLFSFVHFRSYSMLALPAPNTAPVTGPVKTESSKPSFDLEDWNCYSGQTLWNGHKSGTEELLSFRGVPLERDKFSVRCGLEGICIPGKKMEEETFDINSFTADCNTDKHLI
ncbi:BnaC03g29980D [Brassica napus]|uniref:BnaC03g29980D protein n=1 Tax=Brassica napus TaxID=3708 RepID=A0A078G7D2_BRANA|nr:BnaC03g29980D [Brassica napus]